MIGACRPNTAQEFCNSWCRTCPRVSRVATPGWRMSPSSPHVAQISRTCTPRAVLAAKTPEAVNASSSGCAKQASMRNCAMSSLLLSRLIYFSDLSREARSTSGDKPPLDHKDVGVTEVLQGRHQADRFVTIVTIDDQRYVLGGRFTRDLAL